MPAISYAQSKVSTTFIDSIAELSLEKFPQAGFAIGVIQNGEISHLKGYGIASKNSNSKVDENTLFAIASNSKAFTAVALGILADQEKIDWNDKVVEHIPEFKMYDAYVTENFTILDLLTHRSGLGLGAGDLMFIPDGSDFTVNDIIKSFQYQTSVSDFRTKYDYDNLLYIVAGEIIHRTSGKSWTDFIEQEIMAKLKMNTSAGIYQNISKTKNIASPHKIENNEVIEIDPYLNNKGTFAAAGGIYSNVTEMANWVIMNLNQGVYGSELKDTLISKKQHQEIWKIHTNISYSPYPKGIYKNHYKGYGLGFFLQDQNGYSVVSHSGGLPGMLSMVTMIPELNAGIIVLTNGAPGGLEFITLTNEIKDKIIGVDGLNWLEWAQKRTEQSNAEADSVVNEVWSQVEKSKKTKIDFNQFTGTYKDNWFGKISIYEKDNNLYFKSLRSPKLHGEMKFYQANTFAIAWEYDNLDCDAFALFNLENGKAISISMKGISPDIDFSFDFHDLDLKRIEE